MPFDLYDWIARVGHLARFVYICVFVLRVARDERKMNALATFRKESWEGSWDELFASAPKPSAKDARMTARLSQILQNEGWSPENANGFARLVTLMPEPKGMSKKTPKKGSTRPRRIRRIT
ncbi:hypothetical protein DICA2_D07712 [Diutina catenulata]